MLYGRIAMLYGRIAMLYGRIAMRPYAPFCPLMNQWLILKRLPCCPPQFDALGCVWCVIVMRLHL